MAKAKTTSKPLTTSGKAVAVQASRAVATVDKELERQIAADSGAGFEEANRDSFAIPFLVVLQDLSPQVKPKMSGYIEGAEPGMIYNTVTQELFEKLRVIPCYFSQAFIEWIPRKQLKAKNLKSGFVAAHPATTPLAKQTTRDGASNLLPNGHELQDTRQHFITYVREDGSTGQGLIAMKSTQLKVSRRWMMQMQSALIKVGDKTLVPPTFAWSYEMGSEEESNDQGSWFTWTVANRERVTDPEVYAQAKAFHAAMKTGAGKVNYDDLQTASGGAEADGPPSDLEPDDNEIDA